MWLLYQRCCYQSAQSTTDWARSPVDTLRIPLKSRNCIKDQEGSCAPLLQADPHIRKQQPGYSPGIVALIIKGVTFTLWRIGTRYSLRREAPVMLLESPPEAPAESPTKDPSSHAANHALRSITLSDGLSSRATSRAGSCRRWFERTPPELLATSQFDCARVM